MNEEETLDEMLVTFYNVRAEDYKRNRKDGSIYDYYHGIYCRVANSLRHGRVNNIECLKNMNERQLLNMKGISRQSIKFIKAFLSFYDSDDGSFFISKRKKEVPVELSAELMQDLKFESISYGDMTLLFREIDGRKTVAIAPEKGYIIQTVREDCIVLTIQK